MGPTKSTPGVCQVPPMALPDPVWLKNSTTSCRVAIIIAQQPTEALSLADLTAVAPKVRIGCDELIVEPLMIALRMVVGQILLDDIVERSFTEHKHAIKGFFFDGVCKAFTMGIEIGTPRW